MAVREKEYQFLSTNDREMISGIAQFPMGRFCGMVQFVHDRGEHIGRYKQIMRRLADAGYAVFGHNHMGHGPQAEKTGTLGSFSGDNNYLHMIDDVKKMYAQVLPDCSQWMEDFSGNPQKPVVRCLIGIGTGADIVKAYIVRNDDCNAVILCGDRGFPSGVDFEGGKCARLIEKLGGRESAEVLWKKREELYNRYIENPDRNAWRTTSPSELKKYNEDSLCQITYDLDSYRTLIQLEHLFRLKEWVDSCPEYLPVYIMAGLKDPVSNYTRELDRMLQRFRYSDLKNIFYKYYKNSRHDIFFDVESEQVFQDMMRFLNMIYRQWVQKK